MPTGVCHPLFIRSYCFEKVMKWKWRRQISNPSWQLQALWKLGIMIKNLCLIKFTSRRKDGIPRKAYMDSKGSMEIRKEAAKLPKVTTIVPYRLMRGPIIEEINDD